MAKNFTKRTSKNKPWGNKSDPIYIEPFLDENGGSKIPIPCYFILGDEAEGTTGPVDDLPDGGQVTRARAGLGPWPELGRRHV